MIVYYTRLQERTTVKQIHLVKMEEISPRPEKELKAVGRGESFMIEHRSKFLKLEGRAELGDHEQLLPGIPNDITMGLVVPKLPWIAFHRLSSVSRRWRRVIRSREVYHTRVRTQSTQALLVMDHGHDKNPGALALYSVSDESCCRLPSIPGFEEGLPYSCEFCFLDGKLYVLGGFAEFSADPPRWYTATFKYGYDAPQTERKHCANAYVLDVAGQREWKQCASMAQPRVDFGCGVMNGKIYVFGGNFCAADNETIYCGSEVYDPASDAWSPIAPMELRGSIQQVFRMGEEFFVHCMIQFDNFRGFNPLEVYNPLKNQWRSMGDIMQSMDILFTMGGELYKLVGMWGAHGINVFDISANSWKPLQSSSFSVFGSRESFELSLLDAVAVDDELLCVANCKKEACQRQTYLMRSQGLGCPNKEIEWEKTQCSLSFNNHQGLHILCAIQL